MRKNLEQDIKFVNEKSFVDLPDVEPNVKLPLQSVGISNRPHYISIIDPFNTERQIQLFSRISVLTNLAADRKGLHMSRIERCFHDLNDIPGLTFQDYSEKLCQMVIEKQGHDTNQCKILIEVDYEKLTDKNISGKPSHELYKLHVKCELNQKTKKSGIGLTAQIINACPCTQRWGMRDYYNFLITKNYSETVILELLQNAPLQAHTNRGTVKLFIEDKNITFQDLHDIIEGGVPIIRELLASQDEHLVVKRAHEQGFYCEDVAREIAAQTYIFGRDKFDHNAKIKIEAEIDESIHFHNLYCRIDTSINELSRYIDNKK